MNFFATKTTLLESALEYAQKGFHVFPVHYIPADSGGGSFSPMVAGGGRAASTEPEQILQWWATFPDALIAVSTGAASGILAVTTPKTAPLDTKTPTFSTFFSENCYIFQYPTTGEKPACGALDGGSFQGEGGFIVVPPSVLTYRTPKNETISGCYAVLQDGEMQGAPEELLEKMRRVATVEKAEKETVTPTMAKPDILRAVEKPEPKQEPEEQEEEEGLPGLPLECLPEKLQQAIKVASEAFCVDYWLPFAAALRTATTIIGANVMLNFRKATPAPGHLWICLVGDSGIGKTEITSFFNKPVYRQQALYSQAFQNALEWFDNEEEKYKIEKAAAIKNGEEPPKKPISPRETALFVDDVTPEKLSAVLVDNPAGVIWDCDEIKSLLNSFGRYGGAGSGEAAKKRLLTMYSGKNLRLDRKGQRGSVNISNAWISIFGSIQPEVLPSAFDTEDSQCGFLQRFMFIHSDSTKYVDIQDRPELDEAENFVEAIFGRMVDAVQRLDPDDKESKPLMLNLSKDGKEFLSKYINKICRKACYLGQGTEGKDIKTRAARWIDQVPRLVLLLHCIERCSKGAPLYCKEIDDKTVKNAVRIFMALERHSETAWDIIKGKKLKGKKCFDLLDIVDEFIDKSGTSYELRYPEKTENGTTVGEEVLKRIGGQDTVNTKNALTKALEIIGFTKKNYNKGIKLVIPRAEYEKKREKQKEVVKIPEIVEKTLEKEEVNGLPADFFKEFDEVF